MNWPLIQFSAGRVGFTHNLNGTFLDGLERTIEFPNARYALLEHAEKAMVRGLTPDVLDWIPPAVTVPFFDSVFGHALKSGGLRVMGESPPIESIRSGDKTWCEHFPIVHVIESRFYSRPADAIAQRHFIYFNPEGESLPFAEREAKELAESLGCEAAFRSLSEGEWEEQLFISTHLHYFGHASLIGGIPAIPSRGSWIPLYTKKAPLIHQTYLLSSCLEKSANQLQVPGGSFVFPVCRIADRNAGFHKDIALALTDGLPEAYHRACCLDAERGDVRRFSYRLQIGSHFALTD